ncbi:MAG TPA: HIT domain-containing protein [Acidimicrobiales bacterium]|nr:HIT domain-containing protein [Acidimicrobiales bacterium]
MPDCLFCGIVAGDVRSEQVATTAGSIAFRDLNPVAPTHVLVIPRRHIENAASIHSVHAEAIADMFELANQVAQADGLENGYRLVFNVGDDAGNSVPHLHLHVIGGRKMSWPPG